MLVAAVAALLDRDLRALKREVEAYPDETQLWQQVPGMANTAGTLALHLAGNLRHYIGARLGTTGYVRDRAAEFSRRDVSREEMLTELETARTEVGRTLAALESRPLPNWFPEVITEMHVETEEYLVHLCTHVAYHLGQVDTHRRLVTGQTAGVGAVRPAELASARPAH
jgi:uncharacterized damage-inducible protein DinB